MERRFGDVAERLAAAALGTRRRAPHPEARLGAHIVLLLLLGAADPAGAKGGDVHPERLRADEPALVLHPRQAQREIWKRDAVQLMLGIDSKFIIHCIEDLSMMISSIASSAEISEYWSV
ncbi:uncharacterized protein [Triticum aestivum]|nr:uncharacterized protein LOC123180185 [Triticum aestivum]